MLKNRKRLFVVIGVAILVVALAVGGVCVYRATHQIKSMRVVSQGSELGQTITDKDDLKALGRIFKQASSNTATEAPFGYIKVFMTQGKKRTVFFPATDGQHALKTSDAKYGNVSDKDWETMVTILKKYKVTDAMLSVGYQTINTCDVLIPYCGQWTFTKCLSGDNALTGKTMNLIPGTITYGDASFNMSRVSGDSLTPADLAKTYQMNVEKFGLDSSKRYQYYSLRSSTAHELMVPFVIKDDNTILMKINENYYELTKDKTETK